MHPYRTAGGVSPGVLPARQRAWWDPGPAPEGAEVISTRRAYVEVLGVYFLFFGASIAVAAFQVTGHGAAGSTITWSEAIPDCIDQVATMVLCLLVPGLLAYRRRLTRQDLGLRAVGEGPGRSQGIRIAAWGMLAFIVGNLVTSRLATGTFPVGQRSAPDLVVNLFHALQAGPIEEVVALAFTVSTLEQARRPRREIIAVALLLRAGYHIYYGTGVLGIFIWAAVFIWLFLRFRTIVPLVVLHSSYDILVMLGRYWLPVAGILGLGSIVLLVTGAVLWLVDRNPPPPAPVVHPTALPGWYPDPAGTANWRWYDGYQWTPAVHPMGQPVDPRSSGWHGPGAVLGSAVVRPET